MLACDGGKIVAAAVNFRSHLAIRQRREIRMRTGVRTELDTTPGPFANLVLGHQIVRSRTSEAIPHILAADVVSDDEHGSAKVVAFQHRQRVRRQIRISVVERQKHGPTR
jgi:hypothetical protein